MKNPQRINLNTADAKLMASSLHGIGQGLAEDIVKLRDNIAETQGRDIELEDLTQIPPNRIPLAVWKDNFVRNYICFDDTMNPPSRKEVCEVFPAMFSAEEIAAYEAAVLGNLGVIKSHLDTEMNKLRTEQSEQNTKIESVQVAVSQQIEDTQQALKSEISTVNTDLLSEISRVNRSTESLMDSIRAMRDQLTRSSKAMQETVDSVLAKVEEHDKALRQKLSSSPSRTQTSNTAVPPATVVPPIVHPQYGIPAPVPPNHFYNPNAYFNPVVPPVPFVRPPPMVIGPPPYHPPTVHSSPINPSPTLPSTNHTSSDSSYRSLSRDVPPLSSPLHDSNKTSLKEVVGATKSSSLHIKGPPDHQKPLHAGNDGNGDNSDGNDGDGDCRGQQKINPSKAQLPDSQIGSASAVPEHINHYHENINKSSQTLYSEGRKDDQIYCKPGKTNQSLKAMSVLERVTLLKQSMNTMQTSIKESSEAFERKVDVILTKVGENERMLQMKYPWLQDMMSNTHVPSVTNSTRCAVDSHVKAIDDMNSSPMRVPINPHSIPIKHINSNPKTFPIDAHLNLRSSSSCDRSSSMDTMSTTTKLHVSSSHKSSPCKRRMSIASDESPRNIKFPSTTKYEDQECFPQFPTKDGNVYSISIAPCVKCNQPTQGSLHQQHSNMYVNSSLAGCVACEYECNVNEQLFSIEDIDSDLHSGNIPELEYLKSLSRLIMSPHQSCMRSLFPEYVLPIPIKRRRFKIPNVSNKSNQYHSIHQHHHHDATPALDSRLYDRGRSYNKGQSYDRGWKCILLRFVLHSPKTCSVFPKDLFCLHPINPFNILAHML